MLKIAIGIHGEEVVRTKVYFNHITMIAGWTRQYENIFLIGTEKQKVASARNVIVRGALKEGCTHWLSLDTDHEVRPDLLPLLLENADAAMVSGIIPKRAFPFSIVAFKKAPFSPDPISLLLHPNTGVKEVDGCAMGCTLINLEKLQQLPKPYFYDTADRRSDLNLCHDLRARGERILVDTRAMAGHSPLPRTIWPDDAQELRELSVRFMLSEGRATCDKLG